MGARMRYIGVCKELRNSKSLGGSLFDKGFHIFGNHILRPPEREEPHPPQARQPKVDQRFLEPPCTPRPDRPAT